MATQPLIKRPLLQDVVEYAAIERGKQLPRADAGEQEQQADEQTRAPEPQCDPQRAIGRLALVAK